MSPEGEETRDCYVRARTFSGATPLIPSPPEQRGEGVGACLVASAGTGPLQRHERMRPTASSTLLLRVLQSSQTPHESGNRRRDREASRRAHPVRCAGGRVRARRGGRPPVHPGGAAPPAL